MPARHPDSSGRPRERHDDHTASVSLDGDRLVTYAEYGRSDGVPAVFLHGTPGSRYLARLFDDAASDSGVRLLAPDRPGYGRSTPWTDRSVGDAGEFVTAVLDDAGVDTAGVIAFSGGAPHGLATAATRPERITRLDVVAGVTPPGSDDELPAVQRLLSRLATTTPTVLRGLFRGQAWLAARLDPSFVVGQYTTGGADTIDDEVAATVKADFLEAFAHHRRGAVTEFRHAVAEWGIDHGRLDVPIELWYGDDDTNVPIDGARRLERTLPNAELHVLAGADHLRTLLRATPELLRSYRCGPR